LNEYYYPREDVTTIARTRGSLNTALLVGAENISQSLLIVVLYTQTKFTWNIIIVDDCAALKLNKKQFLSGTLFSDARGIKVAARTIY
jgi:hypothetical protein